MTRLKRKYTLIKEGLKIGLRDLKIKLKGYPSFGKTAEEICEETVSRCLGGEFINAGLGHFQNPWVRDMGIFADSIVKEGYEKELKKSLRNSLNTFEEFGKTTTSILGGCPVDIYGLGSDTLPFILHTGLVTKNYNLLEKHEKLLNKEIKRFFNRAFDQNLGLVKKDIYLSGAKDCIRRFSSTYNNTMVAWLKRLIGRAQDRGIDLPNPFKGFQIKERMRRELWEGSYFKEDLKGNYISSDANIFPFYLDIFKNKEMEKSAISSMQEEGLNKPFPIKYSKERKGGRELGLVRLFTPNYQGNTIWTQMGLCYIDILSEIDESKAKEDLKKIKSKIEEHGVVLEVFKPDGSPYSTPFYSSDYGMIWAVHFLQLSKKLGL